MRHDQGVRSKLRLMHIPVARRAKVEIPMHFSIAKFVANTVSKFFIILLPLCLVSAAPANQDAGETPVPRALWQSRR